MKFLGVQWCGMQRNSPSKGCIVASGPSCNQERGTMSSGLIWILEVSHSSFGYVTLPIYQVLWFVSTCSLKTSYSHSWLDLGCVDVD